MKPSPKEQPFPFRNDNIMVTTYPSFTSLIGVASASDVFPEDDDIVRAGYVSHRDKSDTCATYLWKIDAALLLIKRRNGLTSPLFQGPQDTTWRFHIDWGDRRLENSQRYVKLTLSFVGNIQSQLRFQAGYEIFKGEDEFRRGHIDLDGSEYKLQTGTADDGGQRNHIEWIHHKDLDYVLQSSLEHNGSLYVGVTVACMGNDQPKADFRPRMSMKNNLPDIPEAQDLILLSQNGLRVAAHKSYLSTWSTRLRDEIDGLPAGEVLDMSSHHGQTLKTLVDFLYTGDLNETTVQGHGLDLLQLTEEFGLNVLQPRICNYLRRNLWREGPLRTFLIADTKPDDEDYVRLRDSAALLIHQNLLYHNEQSLERNEGLSKDELNALRKRVLDVNPGWNKSSCSTANALRCLIKSKKLSSIIPSFQIYDQGDVGLYYAHETEDSYFAAGVLLWDSRLAVSDKSSGRRIIMRGLEWLRKRSKLVIDAQTKLRRPVSSTTPLTESPTTENTFTNDRSISLDSDSEFGQVPAMDGPLADRPFNQGLPEASSEGPGKPPGSSVSNYATDNPGTLSRHHTNPIIKQHHNTVTPQKNGQILGPSTLQRTVQISHPLPSIAESIADRHASHHPHNFPRNLATMETDIQPLYVNRANPFGTTMVVGSSPAGLQPVSPLGAVEVSPSLRTLRSPVTFADGPAHTGASSTSSFTSNQRMNMAQRVAGHTDVFSLPSVPMTGSPSEYTAAANSLADESSSLLSSSTQAPDGELGDMLVVISLDIGGVVEGSSVMVEDKLLVHQTGRSLSVPATDCERHQRPPTSSLKLASAAELKL
ncbi:hypothetical protein BV898_14055 [Hypsibius exemplaris]|uniref:BTB domain-containing protein n=1 Tax=Hypsibius exemplaris TaxID=2072580 RepID=A0A1W0W8X3_HYPEX|nr:hypothetical protein BV898_14055 [Hypsibius exemplaris]